MKSNSCIIAFCTSCLLYVSYAVNPACECVVYQSHGRSHGTFTSPNFPQIYPSNINCILYTFIAELDEIVELTFLEFDLQVSVTSKCTDFLRFFLDLERPEVNERTNANYELCGNISMVQKKHYSSDRSLILEFHTDSMQANNTGFRGIFKFLNKAELEISGGNKRWGSQCTYDFYRSRNITSGRLFSPKYPQNYPKNSNCLYVFYAMKNERVKVIFQNIQLEKIDGSCENGRDFIVVRDGVDASCPVIARYCNTLNGVQVVSSGENLYVQFVSNSRIQRQGFAATFQYIPADKLTARTRKIGPPSATPHPGVSAYNPRDGPVRVLTSPSPTGQNSSDCGAEFVSTHKKSGTFTSPHYPQAYASSTVCRFMFRGQGRERVQLIFTDLDLNYPHDNPKDPYDCAAMDSITVFVNIGGERSNIGVFCGRKRPHMLMSNDNRMEVSFISRTLKPHTAKGFKAEYRFVTDFGISAGRQDKEVVCGFNFKSAVTSNGTFTSPNFPGLYPRNTECHYLFYGTDKEKIHITFLYFDVEGIQPMCRENTQSDYVEFSNFNIKLKDRKMYRFCGTEEENQKKTVHSDGNFFRVTFKSNDIYDATGFEAFYQFMKQEEGPFPGNIARSSGITTNCPAMWMLCHVTISLAFAVLIS